MNLSKKTAIYLTSKDSNSKLEKIPEREISMNSKG